MPTNNAAIETEVTTNTTLPAGNVRILKRQPGLGRLNRLIASATEVIVAQGHANKRFKRNYNDGTATYTCPHCRSTVVAKLEQGRGKTSMSGDALLLKCSVVNS